MELVDRSGGARPATNTTSSDRHGSATAHQVCGGRSRQQRHVGNALRERSAVEFVVTHERVQDRALQRVAKADEPDQRLLTLDKKRSQDTRHEVA